MPTVPLRATTADDLWYHWLPAVERLIAVPEEFREPVLDLAKAAQQLGTDEALVESLVGAGLPADDTPEGLRLDYHDVMNLGLQAGLGCSLAELGERQCMRLAAGRPESWQAARTTRIRLTATCSVPDCRGTPPQPAAPAPRLFGGELDDWSPDLHQAGAVVATVTTRGRSDAPRTAAVRRIHDDLLAGLVCREYQYGWVPEALRALPATAAANRTVDCVVAAHLMREAAHEAGLRARTRRGFLLGLVGVEHAWTEVFEEGRWLPLDPVLAFLAQRHPASSIRFCDFTRGSVHNKVLAWDRSIEEALADHDCPSGGRVKVDCRQLPVAR
ncbi:transglutaminase domain-containing protein [Streptomyces lasiicapitis]|uniref:transglutaminase domain-containing protein n=1 Tax=Streptomyces lasiicapitis TaxID=1923961 RepID=UPI00368A6475